MSIRKNLSWNVLGLVIPPAVALFYLPKIMAVIGPDSFGILAIAWGLIGFASLFDFGVGRATTHGIATVRATQDHAAVQSIFATARRVSLGFGLTGFLVVSVAVAAGGVDLIRVPASMREDVRKAFYWLALAMPFQSMSAMYKGVNEAYGNFKGISVVRLWLGISNFVVPYHMTGFSTRIDHLVLSLVFARMVSFVAYYSLSLLCLKSHDISLKEARYSSETARRLMKFGGWFTVSNVINPIMSQSDRLMIGILLTSGAAGLYAVSFDFVVQALVLVGAVTTVLFPKITAMVKVDPVNARRYFYSWLKLTVGASIVFALMLYASLEYVLLWWLGNQLAHESVQVARILAIGLPVYVVGTMYVVIIHAQGDAAINAKSHMIQLPIYLGALYFLIPAHGITGAACAWVGRIAFDAIHTVTWFYIKHGKVGWQR